MRPISDIKIGDVYRSPLWHEGSRITWTVINIDKEEKMIEIKSSYQHPTLLETIWKKNTDRIFRDRLKKEGIYVSQP